MKLVEFDEHTYEDPGLGFNVVDDLCQHMRNDPIFYRKQYYPTMAHMQDKLKKGEPIDTMECMGPMIDKAPKH